MKKTPKAATKVKRQQRDDLDPVSRQRLDRLLNRPKDPPAWAPDPCRPELRRWVLGLTPQKMHAEILNRLTIRSQLVTRILVAWPGAFEEMFGFPLKEKKAAFPTLFLFLERITIDDPSIERDGTQFPMLSITGPSEVPPDASEELIYFFDEHPLSIQNIRLTFRELFVRWLFSPSPFEGKSLGEYQELRMAVRSLGTRHRSRHRVINEILSRGPSVTLGNRVYPVPPSRWRTGISSKLPPAEIARLLLSDKWKLDPQAVKELLAQAPIMVAWTVYAGWLRGKPMGQRDVRDAICPRPMIVPWRWEWPLE